MAIYANSKNCKVKAVSSHLGHTVHGPIFSELDMYDKRPCPMTQKSAGNVLFFACLTL